VRVLILEDDDAIRHTIVRVLRGSGDEIVEAGCCADARSAGACDIGVFDVELPDGDGVELARELLDLGAILAVVFYTGSLTERATELGVVVAKGDDMTKLKAAVGNARERWLRPG
jgi:DNA-binding response OmpR family regulator